MAAMDRDHKELARRLFVLATEIAEEAHEAALSGQDAAAPTGTLIAAAESLGREAQELQAVATAIVAVVGRAVEP